MIVEVSLRIMSDGGIPAVLHEQRRLYVHMAPDIESNLFGSMGLLDRMIDHDREEMAKQVDEHRRAEQVLRQERRGGGPPA